MRWISPFSSLQRKDGIRGCTMRSASIGRTRTASSLVCSARISRWVVSRPFPTTTDLGSSAFTLSPPNIAAKDSERHYGGGRCSDSTATTLVWMGWLDSKQIIASQDSTWLIAIYGGTKALISESPLGRI